MNGVIEAHATATNFLWGIWAVLQLMKTFVVETSYYISTSFLLCELLIPQRKSHAPLCRHIFNVWQIIVNAHTVTLHVLMMRLQLNCLPVGRRFCCQHWVIHGHNVVYLYERKERDEGESMSWSRLSWSKEKDDWSESICWEYVGEQNRCGRYKGKGVEGETMYKRCLQ